MPEPILTNANRRIVWRGPTTVGQGRWAILVAVTLFGTWGLDLRDSAARDCRSSGLHDSSSDSFGGLTFTAQYTNAPTDADYFSDAKASVCTEAAAAAYGVFSSLGFRDPYQPNLDSSGVFDIYIYDLAGAGDSTAPAVTWTDCIGVNGADYLPDLDTCLEGTTSHELFHTVQRRYLCSLANCNNGGVWTGVGDWIIEGQAKMAEDHVSVALDTLLPGNCSSSNRYIDVVQSSSGPIGNPSVGLYDRSYGACLFWKYCAEQFGPASSGPESGLGILREFWQEVESTGSYSFAAALHRAIVASGGESLDDAWQDHAICNYAKDLDLSSLADAARYQYEDEPASGTGNYGPVPRAIWSSGTEYWFGPLSCYSAQYFQRDFGADSCEAIGIFGQSPVKVGWGALNFNAVTNEVSQMSRQQGREYYRTFLASPSTISRVGTILAGLSNDTSYTVGFGTGPLSVSVQSPSTDQPAYPGISSDPGRFLIRVLVEGPDELTPDGPDSLSVAGLEASDFAVTVGGAPASIYSSGYVGGHYALVVQAPPQSADGLYDLTLSMCGGGVSQTVHQSVNYSDTIINHMVVIDVSGSMDDPAVGTSKLDAAKIAATMYVDAVSENHRLGVVFFSGDGSEPIDAPPSVCNDDATPLAGLDFKDATERAFVNFFINALSADLYTSIGDGLWKAQAAIETVPTGDINMITLLSDGIENEGRFWHMPTACSGDAGTPAADRIIPTSTIVNTLAFGADSDQSLMAQIADETDGVMDYIPIEGSGFRAGSLSMTNRLALAYIDALTNAQDVERVFGAFGSVSAPIDVTIPLTESGLADTTFVFNIDESSSTLGVELRDPTGHLITDPADATIFSTNTHVVVHLHGTPTVGDWTATISSTVPAQYLAAVTAANRHGAEVEFSFYQVRTGGLDGIPEDGFEQGVPVRFVAQPTDGLGPILGASFQVRIELPDGRIACGDYDLRDDGKSGDGEANDGTYGAIFTETAQGSREGIDNDVINDPPPPPPGAGEPGTYTISIRASGHTHDGDAFQRLITTGFHIRAMLEDADFDGVPDSWEITYKTDPNVADADADPDEDGLTNTQEFEQGTHPFDPDTDGDGERDGSEVDGGRCPLNPADGETPAPDDFGIVVSPADDDTPTTLPTDALTIRLPWDPDHYSRINVYRSIDTPDSFGLLAQVDGADAADGAFVDDNLDAGRTYYYKIQGESASGALSRFSRVVSGVPLPGPVMTEWTCGAGNWSSTGCWSALYDADPFPQNGVASYGVTMLPGTYVCAVNPPAVTIDSLAMSDPTTELRVVGGHSLTLRGAPSGAGKLAAIGVGSVVRIPGLEMLDGPVIGALELEAGVNGRVEFPRLTSVSGNVTFHAHNDNALAVIECPRLDRLTLGARVRVRSGGKFVAAPLVDIRGAEIEVHSDRSVFDTSQIAQLDDARLFADGGADVSLPIVTSYHTGALGSGNRAFRSKNSSRLSLPALGEIAAAPGAPLLLWAYAGGVLELPAVTEMSGPVFIWVDGEAARISIHELNLGVTSNLHVGVAEPDHVPGGELDVSGSLHCAITNPLNFTWQGDSTRSAVLRMTGGATTACVTLEAAGEYRGTDPSGWVNNFQLDRLRIGPGAQVMLVDDADNSLGSGPEVLYVETLEFEDAAGALHLNDITLHYHTLVGDTGQIVAGNCTARCPGDLDGDGDVDLGDLSSLLSNYGTPSGATLEMGDLDGDGDVDLGDLSAILSFFGTSCP